MTMALANMQIVISRLLRSLRITKGPTRWLNGEPHRQRDNLLNRPEVGKRRLSMTTPPAKRVYPSSPKWGRGATGISFKRPLKLAHCRFILPTKNLPPASGVLPSGPASDLSLGFVAGTVMGDPGRAPNRCRPRTGRA